MPDCKRNVRYGRRAKNSIIWVRGGELDPESDEGAADTAVQPLLDTGGLPEKRCVTLPAIHATKLFQTVLMTTKTRAERQKGERLLIGCPAVTNWGKNETKNSHLRVQHVA